VSEPNDDILLSVDNVQATYNHAITAVHGSASSCAAGGYSPCLAGKTTTLKAVSNLLPVERRQVSTGTIRFEGVDVARQRPGALQASFRFNWHHRNKTTSIKRVASTG